MANIVTGLFETAADAAAAVANLEARGFSEKEISIIAGESFDRESFAVHSQSKLPEGAAIGAGTGGAIGALVAGLTGVGAIATGGAGVLVAGPLVAALAGAGAGAAAGSVVGGLVGLGIPEHEVKHYEDSIERGSVLVGVQYEDGDEKNKAKDIFEGCGAKDTSTA